MLEEDQYLTKINVSDMEQDIEEQHEYWLLAVQAAQKTKDRTNNARTADILDTG